MINKWDLWKISNWGSLGDTNKQTCSIWWYWLVLVMTDTWTVSDHLTQLNYSLRIRHCMYVCIIPPGDSHMKQRAFFWMPLPGEPQASITQEAFLTCTKKQKSTKWVLGRFQPFSTILRHWNPAGLHINPDWATCTCFLTNLKARVKRCTREFNELKGKCVRDLKFTSISIFIYFSCFTSAVIIL